MAIFRRMRPTWSPQKLLLHQSAPIALGLILRRLIGRPVVKRAFHYSALRNYLTSLRLAVETSAVTQALVHHLRERFHQLASDLAQHPSMEVDGSNAFNAIERSIIL
eukprot:GFKZ01004374.1.p5 GENE.GFKZ01004374.1~~GFKZ01004374.1.p5  ORF type:complete len:107 (+),score=4.60 GFKZ01004374.1:663-983(+)